MTNSSECNHILGIIQEEYTDYSYAKTIYIRDGLQILKEKDTYHVTINKYRFCPECGKDIQPITFPENAVNNQEVL